MSEWLLPALVSLGIACGLFPIFLLLLRKPPVEIEDEDGRRELALGGFTEPLASQVPMTAQGQSEIRKLLNAAGFYHRSALTEYRAIRIALTLAGIFLTLAAALLVEPQYLTRTLIIGAIATLLLFSLPRLYLAFRRRRRAQEISRGLPLAMDLMSLNLSAGQNLLTSFNATAKDMQNSHPALAQELKITAKQAELHSLEVAASQFADRVQVPEASNLALLLVQSEKLGTDTSATLSELAGNFRTTARQRAETQANRTSFWMLFPSVFCFWVAAAIILVGPAYLEFFDYRQRIGPGMLNQPRQGIDRANQRTRTPVDPNNPAEPAPAATQPTAP
jgi:tight adherence protein C